MFLQQERGDLRTALDHRHEEIAATAGIADGPDGLIVGDFRDAFKRTESGDAASVGLGDGLGGGNSHAGSIVGAGAGSDDDPGEALILGKSGEDAFERGKEVTFLGSLA